MSTRQPSRRDFNTRPPVSPPGNTIDLQGGVPQQQPVSPPRVQAPDPQQKSGLERIRDVLKTHRHLLRFPAGVDMSPDTLIANIISLVENERQRLRAGTEPTLMLCIPKSILQCAIGAARLGLDFAAGEAFIRANSRKDQDGGHAYWYGSLIIGYMGMINIAARNGFLLDCHPVYEGSEPVIDLGTLTVHHPMRFGTTERGQFIGAYAVARRTSDLAVVRIEPMTRAQIDDIKGGGEAWVESYDEMARSRPIRRCFKYLPKTTPQLRLAQIVTERADNGTDMGDLFGEDQPRDIDAED